MDRFVHYRNTTRGKYSRALCEKARDHSITRNGSPKKDTYNQGRTQCFIVKSTTYPANRIVARAYCGFEERAVRNSSGTEGEEDTPS